MNYSHETHLCYVLESFGISRPYKLSTAVQAGKSLSNLKLSLSRSTCAPTLTIPARFDRDLFLQTPDFNDRLRIIQALLDSARSETLVELSKRVAHSTAGYTGNDLKSVCRTACLNAVGRALQASTAPGTTAESTENLTLLEGHKIELEWPDFALAIGEVRPANLGGSWAPRPPKLDADGGMDQVVGYELETHFEPCRVCHSSALVLDACVAVVRKPNERLHRRSNGRCNMQRRLNDSMYESLRYHTLYIVDDTLKPPTIAVMVTD